ncbi:hypothetical protein [Vibrio cholerae]
MIWLSLVWILQWST